GSEEERVGCNPEPPPEHSDDEVEEGARIATRKQYREPGNDDAEERRDAEEPEHNVVRNRQEPLDERQPAIQLMPRIGVGKLKVHGMLAVRRGILIAQQRQIDGDAGAEPCQGQVPVEPPSWVLLAK